MHNSIFLPGVIETDEVLNQIDYTSDYKSKC